MSSYNISCYNQKTRELEHFEVAYSVYVYIKQLENTIRFGSDNTGLKRLYPGRLDNEVNHD